MCGAMGGIVVTAWVGWQAVRVLMVAPPATDNGIDRAVDPDRTLPLDCHQKWRMARQLSIIEVAALATIVVSVL